MVILLLYYNFYCLFFFKFNIYLDKYLSINKNGLLVGRSDAVSSKEYFEVIFDYDYDGRKLYLKASNGKYVSYNHEGDIVALLDSKDETELRVRSLMKRQSNKSKKELPVEEQVDDLTNVELNYVKKFQKFEDKRILMCKDDASELAKAREEGVLHEKLLDRREKMKSDRMCK
jgi:protein FRG1